MNALDAFKNSPAWDTRYDLPLCPGLDNPWIYGAYALKLMREHGLSALEEMKLIERFIAHARECQIEPGLFNRWPTGEGGFTSHDELMGMAYISTELANDIFRYLEKTDGVYVNQDQDRRDFPDWQYRFNVYRMVWFRPFLKARCDSSLNVVTQSIFAGHLLLDALSTTRDQGIFDQGGRLRIWIMLEAMDKFPIAGAAVAYWKQKMNRLGLSPKMMLVKEPKEFPIFAELGKDEF